MMKAETMRAKSADELKELVMNLRKEQMTLRFKKSGQQLDKTHGIKTVRRDIARVKTLLNEQKLGMTPAKAKAVKTVKTAKAKTSEKSAKAKTKTSKE
jgi:large subunit ribosomal protein L29